MEMKMMLVFAVIAAAAHAAAGGEGGYATTAHNAFYGDAATDTDLGDAPALALYFLEQDLYPGKTLELQFRAATNGSKFLPRSETENGIPFSVEELSSVLTRFGVRPGSTKAAQISQTFQHCHEPAANGENMFCATSVESVMEFAVSNLGTTQVKAASTSPSKQGLPMQQYAVTTVKRAAFGDHVVVCHPLPYPYPILYCHAANATRAYTVSLVGHDGTSVVAVAVCHISTASWNPNHLAFHALKVKPGSVPVCHFLPQGHLLWTRSA